MKKDTRREFITKSATAVAGVSVGINAFGSGKTTRIFGSNDKIRMGFIGIGNRGSQLLNIFMKQPDCEVAALCDIYEPYTLRDRSKVDLRYLEMMPGQIPQMGEKFPVQPKIFNDYRRKVAVGCFKRTLHQQRKSQPTVTF